MKRFATSPVEACNAFWHNRQLILASTRREILGRYRGTALGLVWTFANPLFLLAVYTFVFSVIFKARWGTSGGAESKSEFALILFAGLMIFSLFTECITRAPELVVSNANYVSKVVFPLEILPIVSTIASLFHFGISLVVWLVAFMVQYGWPHWTVILLPTVMLPIIFLILGASWFLASLGVYLRDTSQFVSIASSALMFLTPIFYPASALPAEYQKILLLNPLTPAIEFTRDVLYWGRPPDLKLLAVYYLICLIIAWLGFSWFQKTRKGFADVL